MSNAPRIFHKTALALAVAIATPAVAQMQIEEVIVTAQKREQTLQDVPGSVAAIGSEMMEKTITNNFEDISKITSGISIEGGADGFGKVIRIRGVGTNSFVPAIRPAVGIFLNEIPLGAPEMAYNNLADIERIEILKGPQATLFGKEVSSGAISMHTRRPSTEEVDGYAEGNFGNLGLIEVRGGGNLPISDSMAMRTSAYYNERDELIDNVTVPNRDGGAYEQWGIRAHFQWDVSDDITAMFGFEHHETDVDGSSSIAQEYGDLYQTLDSANAAAGNSLLIVRDPFDRKTDNSDPSNRETDIDMWSLHVDWDINDTWSLNSITSYQDYDFETYGFNEFGTADTSVGPYYLADFINEPGTESTTQELRLNYDGDKLSSILGFFYADTETESYTPFSTPIGIFGGGAVQLKAAGLSDLDEDIEEWAIFSHNIYSFTEELDLTFGLRYSYVDKDSDKGQLTGVGPLAELNSPVVPTTPWADDIPTQSDDWDEVLGTVKLTYWITEDISIYGGWDRGFKAGGHNVCKGTDEDPACPEPFDSETADSFDVGMKGRFFDRTVSWNLSAFYQTYDDYQVEIADELGIGNSIQNAAEVEIQGVESEFTFLFGEHLTINGNISYIDATWDEYKDAGCIRAQYQREACTQVIDDNGNPAFIQDLSGEDLNYAPEWSYNLFATWNDTFAGGWDWYIRGEVAYRDEQFFFPDLDPDLVGDDYTLLNASIGVTAPSGDWDIVVWGKNLDDEEYLSGGARNRDQTQPSINPVTNFEGYRVSVGLERTYGVTARYRF